MRIKTSVFVWVEMKRSAIQRIARCEREGLCPSCLLPLGDCKPTRGCHPKCAKATYRAISAGKLTDEGQVEAGEWKPREGGRKPSNPVSIKANLGAVS